MFILVTDDDPEDRDLIQETIREIDPSIECVTARTGEECIDLLNDLSFLPDLIFLDVNMPMMNGLDCLVILKQMDRLKHVPVVMLSTTLRYEDIEEFKKLGADHVKKPNTYQKLYDTLQRYILKYSGTKSEWSSSQKKTPSGSGWMGFQSVLFLSLFPTTATTRI